MGLNVNYSLLLEGHNSTSVIPEYRNYYTPGFITESEFASCLSAFNQEIRESREFLSNLYEVESVNEATAAVNIVNGIRSIAARVKTAIVTIMTKILEAIKKVIESIENIYTNIRNKIDLKLRPNERINILRAVLAEEPLTLNISNIEPTRDLMDKSFPDTSILGSDLVRMATDTMNNYCTNIVQKDGADASLLNDTEVKASESFVKFIEGEKNKMLSQIFGKYPYDETAVTKSAHEAADKAFGVSDKTDTKVTDSLYMLACDNLDKNALNGIVRDMKATMDQVQKNYRAVVAEMDTIADSVKYFDKMTSNKYSVDMKERYYKATKTITERVNRALNVIQQVVNANFVLITRKANRVYEIFGAAGDSAKVKNKCDMLIIKHVMAKSGYDVQDAKYTDLKAKVQEAYEEIPAEVVNGREEVEEFFQIQDEFNAATVMAEEAFLEEAFTGVVMTAILEAEGSTTANANNNKPQATETTVSQNTNVKKPAGASVMEFVQKLIGSLGQAMQRFKNRIDELIINNPINQQYWKNKKANIQKLSLTDTKVNEWYDYNINYFANSTFIKFDQNSPDLKSDEDFQNAILRKITGGGTLPQFGEKDTFAQKVNKVYQGDFTKVENSDGKTLQEVHYDHAKAYALVDEIMTRGFGGEILGKVANDYKEIDTDYKAVKKNYESIASQMKPSTNPEQKANETNNQKPEPQNAAAMVEDDFRFNLAEHFGLVHNEASFTVGQNDSQSVAANGGGDDNSNKNKELDAMIKRCFQYNTVAVTAKMTAALGAYKQYMSLYKAVYKPSKKDNTVQQNNNQQQNNQQQNQNQNNQQQAKPEENKK